MTDGFDNKTLPEQTADRLMEIIRDSNLKVGEKLPNELELAKLLSVGRSTVREAVRILSSRNILVVKRGAGTFIADNIGVSDDPLGLYFSTDRYTLAMELIEVRIILEPEIASMAAIKATDEDIKEIMKRCKNVENLYAQNKDHMREDIAFHEAIARCTKNSVIEKLVPIINTSVAVFANITARKLKDETIATHREVATAIANHDSATAKYAMLMHLIYNRRKIAEIVNEHNGKE